MGFDFIKKLPTPEEIRNQYPIDAEIQAVKDTRDKELRDVFTGKSDKFLAIIGPCSADNEDAVLDCEAEASFHRFQLNIHLTYIPSIFQLPTIPLKGVWSGC